MSMKKAEGGYGSVLHKNGADHLQQKVLQPVFEYNW